MDERLTLLERAVRKADGAALTELVGRLERLLTPAEVEARVTDLVDEANLDPGVWMPALVGAFGVERFRRARALTFDAKTGGKKGRDVEELQFERHGASFGLRPETASLLVIDADDREVSYASDVTPALLLRLLRDRARLDLDLDAPEMTADPFDEDDRFLQECDALDLSRDGALLCADAWPLRVVLEHEPGPTVARLRGVRLDDHPFGLARGVHFEAGDGLPRRVYTDFDLRRCCERLARDAGRTHRSRGDLGTFLGWTVRLDEGEVEVEPFEAGFGGRVSFVETCFCAMEDEGPAATSEPHDVTVSSPLRATAVEVLADALAVREGGGMRGEVGWTDSHEQRDDDDDDDDAERGGDEDEDEDDGFDVGSARDD